MKFTVVENLFYPIILGMSWWQQMLPTFDYAQSLIILNLDGLRYEMELAYKFNSEKVNETNKLSSIQELDSLLPQEFSDFAHSFDKKLASVSVLPEELTFKFSFVNNKQPVINTIIYPLDLKKQEALKNYIDDKLAISYIKSYNFLVVSPVTLVPKASDKL